MRYLVVFILGLFAGSIALAGYNYSATLAEKNIIGRAFVSIIVIGLCVLLPLGMILSGNPKPEGLYLWGVYLFAVVLGFALARVCQKGFR